MSSRARPSAREVFFGNHSADEQHSLERAFFGHIRLPNGTTKTTYAQRLEDFSALCNAELRPRAQAFRLLDVGVSSGITTLEWMRSMESQKIKYQLDAIDICLDAKLVSVASFFHILLDSQARPLQFEVLGWVTSADYGHDARSRLKRAAIIPALRGMYRTLTAPIATHLRTHNRRDTREIGPYRIRSLKLVTRALGERKDLRLFEMDARDVDELQDKYDLIRAANVLNKAYFPTPVLRTIVYKLLGQLNPGGRLAVVRTSSRGTNNGSIYASDDSGMIVKIGQLGEGAEIDDLVLGLPASSDRHKPGKSS